MKKIFITLLLIASISCNSIGQTGWQNTPGTFGNKKDSLNVLIVTGQSNAGSHGTNNSLIPYFSSNKTTVYHWITGTKTFDIYDAAIPVHTGYETRTASAQDSLRGKPIYVININQGSLAISNWAAPSGSMWVALKAAVDTAFSKINAMGYEVKVLSTDFAQGEENVVQGTSQAAYQAALSTFIDNYRALSPSLANSQFVMNNLRTDFNWTGSGTDPNYININTSFANMVSTKTNCAVIDPTTIGATTVDGVHYTAYGYILIANAWNALIPNF